MTSSCRLMRCTAGHAQPAVPLLQGTGCAAEGRTKHVASSALGQSFRPFSMQVRPGRLHKMAE